MKQDYLSSSKVLQSVNWTIHSKKTMGYKSFEDTGENMKINQILMPIKPQYAYLILEGKKKYEYRKQRCKRDIDCMVIYATSPVKKVVGEVEVLNIIEDTPEKLWEMTKESAGVNQGAYEDYFNGKALAVAYMLGDVIRYEKALSELSIDYVPQSYVYLEEDRKKKQQKP